MSSIDPDELFDAVVLASEAFLDTSLAALAAVAPEVNLTEYRVLVILDDLGPQRLIDVAAALEVTSTTATRLADRLVKHGLVERVRHSTDRREIHLEIGEQGRGLVLAMTRRRRLFLSSALAGLPVADQAAALRVLARFSEGPLTSQGAGEATGTA